MLLLTSSAIITSTPFLSTLSMLPAVMGFTIAIITAVNANRAKPNLRIYLNGEWSRVSSLTSLSSPILFVTELFHCNTYQNKRPTNGSAIRPIINSGCWYWMSIQQIYSSFSLHKAVLAKYVFQHAKSHLRHIVITIGRFNLQHEEIRVPVFFDPTYYPTKCVVFFGVAPPGFIVKLVIGIVFLKHHIFNYPL